MLCCVQSSSANTLSSFFLLCWASTLAFLLLMAFILLHFQLHPSRCPLLGQLVRALCTRSRLVHHGQCLLSPPFGTSLCFQPCLRCDRHHANAGRNSPASNPSHIPQIPTCVFHLSLIWKAVVSVVGPHTLLAPAQSFLLRLKGNVENYALCGGLWDVPSLYEDQDAMLVFKNVCHANVRCCWSVFIYSQESWGIYMVVSKLQFPEQLELCILEDY